MAIANLRFPLIFIHASHPLYICKHNLQTAMDKEDCKRQGFSFHAIRPRQFISVPFMEET